MFLAERRRRCTAMVAVRHKSGRFVGKQLLEPLLIAGVGDDPDAVPVACLIESGEVGLALVRIALHRCPRAARVRSLTVQLTVPM